MGTVVYTVILGGYDNLRKPEVIEPGVRYICFSDQWHACPPWEIHPAPLHYKDTSRNSRIPKILPHLMFDSDYSIYHDGCLRMAMKPSELVAMLDGADLAMYPHPCRKSVAEEMDCCRRFDIGYGPEMEEQVARYKAHGISDELWAGGVLVRRHSDLVTLFNESWWRQYKTGCSRDQFALAFARHSVGLNVARIEGNILEDSKRFQFCWHADFEHIGDNGNFAVARRKERERLARLKGLL